MKTIKNISVATICGDIKQTYILKICVVMIDSYGREEFYEMLVTPDEFRDIIKTDQSPQISNYYFRGSKLEIDSTVVLKPKEGVASEYAALKSETTRVSNIGFTSFECLKLLCRLDANLIIPYVETGDCEETANTTLTSYFSEQKSLIEETPEEIKYHKIPLRKLKPAKTTQRILISYVIDGKSVHRRIGSYTSGNMTYEILELEMSKEKFKMFYNNPNVLKGSVSLTSRDDDTVRFKVNLNEYMHQIDSPYYHQNLRNIFAKDITKLEYYNVRLEALKFVGYILSRLNQEPYPDLKAKSFIPGSSEKMFGIVSVKYESGFKPHLTISEFDKLTDTELNQQLSRLKYLKPASVNNYFNSLYDSEIYNLLNKEDLNKEYVDEQIRQTEISVSDYALTNFRDRYLAYKYKGVIRPTNSPLLVGNLKINIGGIG